MFEFEFSQKCYTNIIVSMQPQIVLNIRTACFPGTCLFQLLKNEHLCFSTEETEQIRFLNLGKHLS